jgi:murein DD-endopeptidase MepM/ murein hydrolase activator NlpD
LSGGNRGLRVARRLENCYYTAMLKKKRFNWGRKSAFFLAGLALGGVALLVWLVLASLDWQNPWLEVSDQVAVVSPQSAFTLKAGDRESGLKEVRVTIRQAGQEKMVLSRTFPPGGEGGSTVEIPVTVDPKALGLREGQATFNISARDRSWRNFFQGRGASLTWKTEVHLVPITVSFTAVSHLLRPGGSGLIVYRVNKTPQESGVRVGERFFPGYPVPKGSQGEYGAFVAFPLDAPASLPVEIVARAGVGSEAKQTVSLRISPKRWRHDNMNLSEGFLHQVAAKFPEAQQGDLLKTFLEVNRKMRQANHDQVLQVCAASQPQPLWSGAFVRMEGKAMARFGDRRTYIWQNRAVDEQVHQGEDLASLIQSPVPAANNGVVVMAEPLGIYGNTVILDHGMGVFSMYSHLSKMDVKTGERVEKGKTLGLTGTTGLAGGDHLHFSMMIHGDFVNPVEWWDAQWLRDQVEKVWAKGAPAAAAPAAEISAGSEAGPGKAKTDRGKKRKR